jgi:exonuclease VII small subunit
MEAHMQFRKNSAFDEPVEEMQKVLTELRSQTDQLKESNGNLANAGTHLAVNQHALEDVHARMIALVIYLQGNSQIPPYVIDELEDINREIYAELH